MDFDELLRAFVAGGTRRAVLAVLASIGVTLAGDRSPAMAQGKKKKACRGNRRRCSGKCTNTRTDDLNCGDCGTACAGDTRCRGGKCKCDPGLKLCGEACIAADRCCTGDVSDACAVGQSCDNGACGCPAAACDQATNPVNPQNSCFCDEARGIGQVCMGQIQCTGSTPCPENGDCPTGQVCQTNGCGTNPTCVPTCTLD